MLKTPSGGPSNPPQAAADEAAVKSSRVDADPPNPTLPGPRDLFWDRARTVTSGAICYFVEVGLACAAEGRACDRRMLLVSRL